MAFPKASPDPEPQPHPSAAPQPARWRALGRISILLVALLAAAAGWYLRPRPKPDATLAGAVRIATVRHGILQRTVRLSGSITTKTFFTIAAPRLQSPDTGRGRVLLYLPMSGSDVKKDDVIARLDTESIEEHLDDVEAQVVQMGLNLRRVEADQAVRAASYRQRARVAKANLQKARLEAGAAQIRNQFDQEMLRLAVDEAQLQYQEAERQISLSDESIQSEVNLSQYSFDYQIRHRTRHRSEVTRSTLHAPITGKIVLRSITRNGETRQVRQGDEVAPGQPFMRIADLGELQMEASMSQTESEHVRPGQKATIRFDAYPGLVLEGRVDAVGSMAVSGRRFNYYVRSIPVRIVIDGGDPRVIPDLTASAEVVIGEEEAGLIIPRDAVRESGGKPVVMVKQGDTVSPRTVAIGVYGNTEVSVISGLQENEQIVSMVQEK